MPQPRITLLTAENIQSIHASSLRILERDGVIADHDGVCLRLAEIGARVDRQQHRIWFDANLVLDALEGIGKSYILHSRNPEKNARFGFGDLNLISSPGQFTWFDPHSGRRRAGLMTDVRAATILGDHLTNITVVGAMTVPLDVPHSIRDVITTAEIVKMTQKPTRCWPVSRSSSHYVLEIYAALAGSKANLLERPMTEFLLEPISPLKLPGTALDIAMEFIEYGQPICVAPMAMASGTAPATLAGTLAQQNAEILAGIAIVHAFSPGHPIMYGGIPHIMDPRSSICSFGSPEQGLMAVAMSQMGHFYGLPVYINVNLTDSKSLDIQAGMEKMGSLVLGILSGADLFGHAGIVGTDHGCSLTGLMVDNEAMDFAKRIARGFSIDEEHLAEAVIHVVGPGGNFLSERHTVKHFRQELWMPGSCWTREPFDVWAESGRNMEQRLISKMDEIIKTYDPVELDPMLEKEIDSICQAAISELQD